MAVHVTDVFVLPETLALNCCVPPATIDTVVGVTEIATGTETVTVAEADLVVSATLVAFTV